MAGHTASSFEDEGDALVSEINVTPLVDVTLVLLIVFMITVPAIVGSAPIKVNVPESTAVSQASEVQMPLTISVKRESGELAVYVNERRTDLDGLSELIRSLGALPEDEPVTLAADEGIPYGEVVHVMDILYGLNLRKLELDTRHVEGQ
jgi:biopolymer transport protein ExbD